jgi:hypothetical protein
MTGGIVPLVMGETLFRVNSWLEHIDMNDTDNEAHPKHEESPMRILRMPKAMQKKLERLLDRCYRCKNGIPSNKPPVPRTESWRYARSVIDCCNLLMVLGIIAAFSGALMVYFGRSVPLTTVQIVGLVMAGLPPAILLVMWASSGSDSVSADWNTLSHALRSTLWESDNRRGYLKARRQITEHLDVQFEDRGFTAMHLESKLDAGDPALVTRFVSEEMHQRLCRLAGKLVVKEDPRVRNKTIVYQKKVGDEKREMNDLRRDACDFGICDAPDRTPYFENPIIKSSDWDDVGVVNPDPVSV